MTVRVCRNCGRGHWRSLFYKLPETPLKVFTVKNVKLKSDSHLLKKCVICFVESPLKMMKNAFYFILIALFVLKVLKFAL